MKQMVYINCSICMGTGKVGGMVCAKCKGTGIRPTDYFIVTEEVKPKKA